MDRSVCSKHNWAYCQGDCPDCAEEEIESLRARVAELEAEQDELWGVVGDQAHQDGSTRHESMLHEMHDYMAGLHQLPADVCEAITFEDAIRVLAGAYEECRRLENETVPALEARAEQAEARVAELEAELDALCEAEGFPRLLSKRVRLIAEKHAALARAEKAERGRSVWEKRALEQEQMKEQAERERDAALAECDALDHQLQRTQADYGWAVNGARRMKAQRDAWRAATGCKGMTPEEAGARLDQIEEGLEAERDALQRRCDRLVSGDEIESDRLAARDDLLLAALAALDALQQRVDAALALYRRTGRWDARPARILRGEDEGEA